MDFEDEISIKKVIWEIEVDGDWRTDGGSDRSEQHHQRLTHQVHHKDDVVEEGVVAVEEEIQQVPYSPPVTQDGPAMHIQVQTSDEEV